ncbi:hypothetical protein NHF48_000730 [Sphingomonas sp. H160509]|uniref:dual OB domain-containing protein n=1 Tax=Sphingomonas sp. H160509 TaxID=2955313 RepID=UPI002097CB13|nr:hypothetical protein [Sphingomonas sp. H160509]MDD1449783.1 hypothetical protein [Sphingomonas sp. H160509]
MSVDDRRYQDGNDCSVLDVVTIPMLSPQPHAFQVENQLIDAQYYWRLQRRANYDEARAAVDNRHLWANLSSSYNGTNDRVAEDAADPADGSLRLIEVNDLEVRVAVEGAAFGNGKRRVRGYFNFRNAPFLLSITDPHYEAQYLAHPDGRHAVGRALLCVSLGEPWQGFAYKLIAAIIRPNE